MNNQITNKWGEIKILMSESDVDLEKASKGNKAAGVRLRKQIKLIEYEIKILRKLTLQSAKQE